MSALRPGRVGTHLGLLLCLLWAGPAVAEDEPSALGELFGKKEVERKPLPWEVPRQGEEVCRPEEMAVLRELRERSLLLDKRETSLAARERMAAKVEADLAEELARVEALRAGLLEVLERTEAVAAENTASLAKMVDAMKAKDAAGMLGGMDEDVALEVLRTIKPKQAGKILAAMDPQKSQRLGDRYTLVPDPRDGLAPDADGADEGADAGADAGADPGGAL